MIEQAIFTSARTARAAGYQVVAASPGVGSADLEEIAVWGPSHDSLVDRGPGATSTNFWRLSSGNYCVARTTTAGGEYSGRVGPCVYTQCLIPPVEVLLKFANNPFAVLRAAMVQGALEVYQEVPRQLNPIRLAGRAAAVDQTVLAEVLADTGARSLAALVDCVLKSGRLAVVSNAKSPLIAALVNCLPIECRLELSFSTGLEVSPRRPFRIVRQPDDPTIVRRIQRLGGWQVFRMSEASGPLSTSWGGYLAGLLEERKTAALATQLAKRRPQLTMATLESLARALAGASAGPTEREAKYATLAPSGAGFQGSQRGSAHSRPQVNLADTTREEDGAFPRLACVAPLGEGAAEFVADPAGDLPPTKQDPADAPAVKPPSELRRDPAVPSLPHQPNAPDPAQKRSRSGPWSTESGAPQPNPEVLEALEQLDDVVFDALVGHEVALESLRRLWPDTLGRLGEQQLAESRDHYLRRALAVWRQATNEREIRDPLQALRAIEVVCLLYGE
ncbi:MAG: hypothetical protein AB7O68_10920 [Pirellulales bacterium]